jgi:3-hydroxyisobutyrate dehydrogenase-like beta-hydroxyacid dehydrogenase
MTMTTGIGILHPGNMGVSVAAAAQKSGRVVYWVSAGRSPETRQRAQVHDLADAETLAALCNTCSMIISVCPPHAAEQVAQQVVAHDFHGIYVDANAIAPQRAERIGRAMAAQKVSFVDGGIIGGPAWQENTTWLYLSGREAPQVADCFAAGPLHAEVIGTEIGKASALKMCYAAYTKGTTALLCAILGVADQLAVRAELERQWSRNGSDFADQTRLRARRVTAKAWRFAGEMEEIADTFAQAGFPAGFHEAAADVYARLADFKGAPELPALETVLAALLEA